MGRATKEPPSCPCKAEEAGQRCGPPARSGRGSGCGRKRAFGWGPGGQPAGSGKVARPGAGSAPGGDARRPAARGQEWDARDWEAVARRATGGHRSASPGCHGSPNGRVPIAQRRARDAPRPAAEVHGHHARPIGTVLAESAPRSGSRTRIAQARRMVPAPWPKPVPVGHSRSVTRPRACGRIAAGSMRLTSTRRTWQMVPPSARARANALCRRPAGSAAGLPPRYPAMGPAETMRRPVLSVPLVSSASEGA